MKKLTDIRPQEVNANRHTERGMRALEQSIQADGWIGAITVAADGETFDGSARLEVGTGAGFEDAIVVESDGTRPVILKRTDIPSADDPRAKRLGVAANRVAELNLEWEPGVLTELREEAAGLFTPEEFAAVSQPSEEIAEPNLDPGEGRYKEQYGVIVLCATEAEQEETYNALKESGYTCKVVVT